MTDFMRFAVSGLILTLAIHVLRLFWELDKRKWG